MTKQRMLKCNNPNCPHEEQLIVSDWIREKLPSSFSGFRVSDVDFVLANEDKKEIMLLEVKTKNAVVRPWQRNLFKNIHKWLSAGIDDNWTYLGFHLLQLNGTKIESGLKFDHKPITTEQLIKRLSF